MYITSQFWSRPGPALPSFHRRQDPHLPGTRDTWPFSSQLRLLGRILISLEGSIVSMSDIPGQGAQVCSCRLSQVLPGMLQTLLFLTQKPIQKMLKGSLESEMEPEP